MLVDTIRAKIFSVGLITIAVEGSRMKFIKIDGRTPEGVGYDVPMNNAVRQMLEEIGVEFLVTLPETPYEILLQDVIKSGSMRIVQVCREAEGISISSGLTYGGKKVAMICSYKGFYNSPDTLIGTAVRTESSFLLLISEPKEVAKSASKGLEKGVYTIPMLKALNIPFYEVSGLAEVARIKQAWEQTRTSTTPIAIVLHW
jgi:sulfopyruvate decarboxylase TPP-binding subunit